MNYWLIVASPFALGFLIVGGIIGWEAYAKWRERRDMRIRDERVSRFGLGPLKGTRDRWLS